ncbi:MAG TPA: DUF3857 domain-containing transglutaminase family protein, partial [Gammaproteobacteria bacterium]
MFYTATQIRHPVLFTLLMLFACAAVAQQADIPVPVEPRPAWLLPLEVEQAAEVPHATVANGIYHLLVDNQVRVGGDAEAEYFFHYAEQVLNQTGVESNSQITVNFDPVYETLVLHDVSVWRDGRQTDRLQTARISLINREEELDSLLYSGSKSLHLILDDIRVGDIIEYSFSIRGDNPIYNGIFAYSRSLNWGIPVHHLLLAVHWLKPGPLHHQIRNSELALDSSGIAGGTLYRIEHRNTEPLTEDENTPHWFNPYGVVYFSESANWRQVADWARPLMESGVESNAAIRKLAARIRNEHREPAARIAAALQYVQDEIRYFGIEIGENSHRPAKASVTLARRYGDCKDKTVLLLSILRELGVEAYAALVNSRKQQQIKDIIPA